MFAKLFETPLGQVLFTIDDNEDGEPGIKVRTETSDGGSLSLHLNIDEDKLDEAFGHVSQDMANAFADEYAGKSAVDILNMSAKK